MYNLNPKITKRNVQPSFVLTDFQRVFLVHTLPQRFYGEGAERVRQLLPSHSEMGITQARHAAIVEAVFESLWQSGLLQRDEPTAKLGSYYVLSSHGENMREYALRNNVSNLTLL